MKPTIDALLRNWQVLVMPGCLLLVVLLVGWLTRHMILRALTRWAEKSETQIDDLLIQSLRGPFMLWVTILGLYIAALSSPLPDRVMAIISRILLVLWIISLTVVASKLAGLLVKNYGTATASVLPVTTLTQSLARFAVAVVGVLILLDTLNISVTPILTALGVGGLAVALALQDTLSNLFAGFYVSLAGQIRVGDYIKLDTGEEGYVTDISWRSTAMRALPNNLIVVPNAKIAQAIITNYHLPENRMSLLIPIGVSYDCDPEIVERILIEEATSAAGQIPGLLAEPAPFVRFIPGFGDSSLDFTLICQVAEFVDQYLVQHELRKRIFKRFQREGIEIPFPIRTVHLRSGGAAAAASSPAAPSQAGG